MSNNKSVKFNCFSPPVMLATLTVESVLAAYTAWRYKLDDMIKLTLATLVCLGAFQLAEYNVCTGFGSSAETWSRFGFALITALPPLAIHMMHKLAGKDGRRIVYTAYTSMAAFVLVFLTYKTAFIGHQCSGNYVIFQLGPKVGGLYTLYYYSWLLAGIGLGFKWANELKNKGKSQINKLQSVRALIISYFIFLVPTAIAYSVKPQARQAIPSVMCGFAILYALILTFYITPKNAHIREYQHAKTA